MYQNRLSLIGFSGKEPEQKTTKNGTAYTVFSLATKTSWKNENDEWGSRTEWHGSSFGQRGSRNSPWSFRRALTYKSRTSFAATSTKRMA